MDDGATPARTGPSAGSLPAAKALLRRHAFGLGLALILAGVLVLPRWWLLTTSPPDGVRVPISLWGAGGNGSDEAREVSVIRQAYDGKLPVRAPYLANHANAEPQAGAGWQEAIGIFGHVTGGPFEALAVVTTVMAVAAMLLLYALGVQLTGSRLIAAAMLPIAIAGGEIVMRGDGLWDLRHLHFLSQVLTADPLHETLLWSRFLWPIMVMSPFFAAVLALPRAVDTGSKRWGAVAAIGLALLVYSYIYFWTAAALAITVWGGWLLYRRDYVAFSRLVAVCVVATLLALPELAITANKSLASTPDAQARVGLESNRSIDLRVLPQRLLIGLPLFYGIWAGRVRRGSLYVCLFLSPLVLASIHGVIPQAWHYRSQVFSGFALPATLAGIAGLMRVLPKEGARIAAVALAGGAVFSTGFVVVFQARGIHEIDPAFAVSRDEYDALSWIRENIDGDDTVVSTSITTNWNLASLTPASEYIMGGFNPVAGDDELIDRYLRASIAFGYSEETTFDRLNPYRRPPIDDVDDPFDELLEETEESVAYYTFYSETDEPRQLARRIPEWRERFEELESRSNILAKYPAEYVYCGERERFWPVEREPSGIYVTVTFHEGTVTVYRLADESDPDAEEFEGCE
jgi:hypothetical protein